MTMKYTEWEVTPELRWGVWNSSHTELQQRFRRYQEMPGGGKHAEYEWRAVPRRPHDYEGGEP